MQINNNLAYDLSRYEDVTPELMRAKIRIHRRRSETAPGSVLRIIAIAAAAGLLLGLVIYGKVEAASLHSEIALINKNVETLTGDNIRMQTEIEGRTAMKYVEYYAENILGMQRLEKSQIEYITADGGNMVEIPASDDNIFVRVKNAFNDFFEHIKG